MAKLYPMKDIPMMERKDVTVFMEEEDEGNNWEPGAEEKINLTIQRRKA